MYRLINYLFGLTLIYLFILEGRMGDHVMVLIGLVLSIFVAYTTFLTNWISLEATKAVVILGTIVLGFGGWTLAFAVAFFFGVSSFLTVLNSRISDDSTKSVQIFKDRRRDGYQVWANGFWVAVFCTLWFTLNSIAYLIAAFAVVAASTADTWATEIGTLNPGKTRKITTFEKVEPGTDGGISLKGTLAGVLGALLIGLFIFNLEILSPLKFFAIVFVGGITGLLIDSFAGAILLDNKFELEPPEDFSDANNSFTNSFINWASTGISGLAAYLITQLLLL
ncbi:MAG: DUF92 domain-containing protein [Bacteroidetes bacterium]|nr:DUF92 domain-containing protein [Bacteroidota bacterium]